MTLTILDLGFGSFGDQVAWESGTGGPGRQRGQPVAMRGEARAQEARPLAWASLYTVLCDGCAWIGLPDCVPVAKTSNRKIYPK